MSISNPKSDRELIIFILEQISVIEEYLKGKEEYEFYRNMMLKDACFARIMVIGEYANRISSNIKDKYKTIEWAVMKKARNFYAHGYGLMDWTRVWETLNDEIPKLKIDYEKILTDL